jgi:hypothetical protein
MSSERLEGIEWLKHDKAMKPLVGDSDQIKYHIWFKSKPLTRDFCQVDVTSFIQIMKQLLTNAINIAGCSTAALYGLS